MDLENQTLITLILSSTVIAGIISVIVSAIVTLILKHLDYKNEYYRIIINKRLIAYEFLERQIAVLKSSIIDESDKQLYNSIFAHGTNKFYEFQQNLFAAISYSFWINDKTSELMSELNYLLVNLGYQYDLDNELIKAGKAKYKEIVKLRKKLEAALKKDLYDLHNVKKFMEHKRNYRGTPVDKIFDFEGKKR